MTADTDTPRLRFFHAPNTRSSGVLALLEELGAVAGRDYERCVIDFKRGEQRAPAFMAINPMGKVPALVDGTALVTEQPAIYQYLAERFPQAGLAPPVGDPQRGPFLRWLAYYGSSFEPAIIDKALKRDAPPPSMCPWGDDQTMQDTYVAALQRGPYFLGERYSAVDVLWGSALTWMLGFKLVPELPVIVDYVARCNARPAVQRAKALDASLAAELDAR